jgi:ABC-type multidrug transport system fused ATPase/permease subunit
VESNLLFILFIVYVYRSGSGKTSILNALFGLYEKENGGIFLKGVELQNMSLKELRS